MAAVGSLSASSQGFAFGGNMSTTLPSYSFDNLGAHPVNPALSFGQRSTGRYLQDDPVPASFNDTTAGVSKTIDTALFELLQPGNESTDQQTSIPSLSDAMIASISDLFQPGGQEFSMPSIPSGNLGLSSGDLMQQLPAVVGNENWQDSSSNDVGLLFNSHDFDNYLQQEPNNTT